MDMGPVINAVTMMQPSLKWTSNSSWFGTPWALARAFATPSHQDVLRMLTPEQIMEFVPERLRPSLTSIYAPGTTHAHVIQGASPIRPQVTRCLPILTPPEEEHTLTLTIISPNLSDRDLDRQWHPLILSTRTGKEITPVFYFYARTQDGLELRVVLPPVPRLDCLRVGIKRVVTDQDQGAWGGAHAGQTLDPAAEVGTSAGGSSPLSSLYPFPIPVIESAVIEDALQLGLEITQDLACLMAQLNNHDLMEGGRPRGSGSTAAPHASVAQVAGDMRAFVERVAPSATHLLTFLRQEVVPASSGVKAWGSLQPYSRWDMDWLLRFRDASLEHEYHAVSIDRYRKLTYMWFRTVYTATFVAQYSDRLLDLLHPRRLLPAYWISLTLPVLSILQWAKVFKPSKQVAVPLLLLHTLSKIWALAFYWKDITLTSAGFAQFAVDRPWLRWLALSLVGTHAWTQERVPFKFNIVVTVFASALWAHVAVNDHEWLSGGQKEISVFARLAISQFFMFILPVSLHYWGEYRERKALALQHKRKHTVAVSEMMEQSILNRRRGKQKAA